MIVNLRTEWRARRAYRSALRAYGSGEHNEAHEILYDFDNERKGCISTPTWRMIDGLKGSVNVALIKHNMEEAGQILSGVASGLTEKKISDVEHSIELARRYSREAGLPVPEDTLQSMESQLREAADRGWNIHRGEMMTDFSTAIRLADEGENERARKIMDRAEVTYGQWLTRADDDMHVRGMRERAAGMIG